MARWVAVLAAVGLMLAMVPARAETSPVPPATISAGQLNALVAPVALYPDPLLTPLLMAASYPAEIAEAAAWLNSETNARLRGDALVAALLPRPWAPSVKALVPFPETLTMLATRPEWTGALGKAFAADPAAVLTAVQTLRHRAAASGKLTSSPRLDVRVVGAALAIMPADPSMIYIPVYNPALVYGAWADPNFPPKFIEPPPGFRVSGADLETGIGFSVGFGVIAPLSGWAHPDWAAGTVTIDTAAYNRINRYGPHVSATLWHHEPHPTGYFHIAQQPAPPPPVAKHPAKLAAKERHHVARHGHEKSRHAAKSHARGHRAASSPHRGERVHLAADRHNDKHRR
ncbi:MAG TPA: DUF3300 domain-containing protein [Stellaceae bacterium]